MTKEEGLKFIQELARSQRGTTLNEKEQLIFRESWDNKTYGQIALICVCSEAHLKTEGAKLWKTVSGILGFTVSKATFRAETERIYNRQQEQRNNRCHNLPNPDYARFIERPELKKLLTQLYDPEIRTIALHGMGGAGKTTLALEAAYRCLQDDTFQAIIFASAKQRFVRSGLILPCLNPKQNLRKIFRTIAKTLKCIELLPTDFEDRLDFIRERLALQKTLLILDNLEVLEEEELNRIVSFLADGRLPATVKTVLTSRQLIPLDSQINLGVLEEKQSKELIKSQIEKKQLELNSKESSRMCKQVHQRTKGIPVAIVYAVGQIAAFPHSFTPSCLRLNRTIADISTYILEQSFQLLEGQETETYKVLLVVALFSQFASLGAIAQIALPEATIDEVRGELDRLQQLSLVQYEDNNCYIVHSLTREYAIAQLTEQQELELELRKRWVGWYCDFVEKYGSKDEKEWQPYEELEQEWQNLQAVIDWCIAHNRFGEFCQIWSHLKGFTHFYSYWPERLNWMSWSIEQAELCQDWQTLAESLFDRGRTLSLLNEQENQDEANQLFSTALEICQVRSLACQRINLMLEIAVLHIEQEHFEEAEEKLEAVQQELLNSVIAEEEKRDRWQVHKLYCEAQVCYKTELYDRSENLYREALNLAKEIGWRRAVTYIEVGLAEPLIALNNLEEAERLLSRGQDALVTQEDKRFSAFLKKNWTYLEQAREDLVRCHCFAIQARDDFQQLKMKKEVQEMKTLLQ